MPKIEIYRDVCFPYYGIGHIDKERCHIEVPQEFLDRFTEVDKRFCAMQDELEELYKAGGR